MTAFASKLAGSAEDGRVIVKPVPSAYCSSGWAISVADAPATVWQPSVLVVTVTAPSPTPSTIVAAIVARGESAGATSRAIARSPVGDSPGAAIVKVTLSPDRAIVSG